MWRASRANPHPNPSPHRAFGRTPVSRRAIGEGRTAAYDPAWDAPADEGAGRMVFAIRSIQAACSLSFGRTPVSRRAIGEGRTAAYDPAWDAPADEGAGRMVFAIRSIQAACSL